MPLDNNAVEICRQASDAFNRRISVDNFRQEVAENFAPHLATFQGSTFQGEDYGAHIIEPSGMMGARDLAGAKQSMTRPGGRSWFRCTVDNEDEYGVDVRRFFDWHTKVTWSLLFERKAFFHVAATQMDEHMVLFGEAPMSIESRHDPRDPGLFVRAYHPSGFAFSCDQFDRPDKFWRRFDMTARGLCQKFKNDPTASLHPDVDKMMKRDPDGKVHLVHCVMPAADYEYIYERKSKRDMPWVSIYIDEGNKHVIRERPARYSPYVVPRWQQVGIDGFSPAAMAALPIGRRLQQMYLSVLENAEKQADPPTVALSTAFRDGDPDLSAGGLIYADAQAETRADIDKMIRPLQIGGDMRVAYDAVKDARLTMAEAWFRDKLSMDAERPETAYAVSVAFQQYVRDALPVVGLLEAEENYQILDKIVEIGMAEGAYGPPEYLLERMPAELRGREVEFRFENPLRDAMEQEKVAAFQAAMEMTGAAAQLDPKAVTNFNVQKAHRDVLGTVRQSHWIYSEEEQRALLARLEQARQEQQVMAALEQGAKSAKDMGAAVQSVGAVAPQGAEAEATGVV